MSTTSLRAALADAHASEHLFRALLESAPDAMVVVGGDGSILLVNAQVERLFGQPREQLLGRPIEVLIPERFRATHVQQRDRYLVSPTLRPMGFGLQLFGQRRDGSEFPVEISLSPIPTPQGLLVACAIRDVTAQKQAERERQVEAEALARSNQDLDDFAYIVSHDLKEPLRGLSSYSAFLLEDYADRLDDDGRRMLQTLGRLCERMESLLTSLLYYSRVGRAELSVRRVDLGKVVHEVVDSLAVLLKESNGRVEVPRPLPSIRCDSVRAGEVFQNLIGNALKYNDSAEKVVEVGFLPQRDPRSGIAPVLYVRDNGIGIPERHRDAVFGMFKRLHGRDQYGGGTGSGLTITRKIVERHGGRIWLESKPGAGTTFFFTLGGDEP